MNATVEEWNYVCNFLYDLFRVHDITRQFFDSPTPLTFEIGNSFFVYSDRSNKTLVTNNGKKKIYYIIGNRKYKFYYDPL